MLQQQGEPWAGPNRSTRGWVSCSQGTSLLEGCPAEQSHSTDTFHPMHPMLTPWQGAKQESSPGTQPWQCTQLSQNSRRWGKVVLKGCKLHQHLNKH